MPLIFCEPLNRASGPLVAGDSPQGLRQTHTPSLLRGPAGSTKVTGAGSRTAELWYQLMSLCNRALRQVTLVSPGPRGGDNTIS